MIAVDGDKVEVICDCCGEVCDKYETIDGKDICSDCLRENNLCIDD